MPDLERATEMAGGGVDGAFSAESMPLHASELIAVFPEAVTRFSANRRERESPLYGPPSAFAAHVLRNFLGL